MKKGIIALLSVAALVMAGCETMQPQTKTGAVAGGVLGGIAGGIIGHQSGRGLEGAAIGAGIGAVSGGVLGSAAAQREKEARAANPGYLSISNIADMGDKGLPNAVIIDEIRRSGSVYNLDSETIAYLKQHKVSDEVIDYMLR